MKVSVVVPVFNPGAHVDDLLRSLDAQSLAAGTWEAILVDDGSTDGTGERLDAWAAPRPHVRVEHIPNSGWPGTPRNVGTELARGDYVLYVDNDDWLDGQALERLHDRAVRDDADVVLGKVVGHGKTVPRALFRSDRTGVGLEWEPLLRLMSPHKLFRRALLAEHGIRFPDGRHRLEDHLFVLHAYFHARGVSVLAEHPIYHWVLRPGANASATFDPDEYFTAVRRVLDLIDAHTDAGEERDRLYAHWFRAKVLKRAGSRNLLHRRDPARRAVHAAVQGITRERFAPRLDARVWFGERMRARVLRTGGYEDSLAWARHEARLDGHARLVAARRDGADLVVHVQSRMAGPDGPLRVRERGDRLVYVPPPDVAAQLEGADLDVTADVARDWLEVVVRSAQRRTEFALRPKLDHRLEPLGDGTLTPVLEAEVRVRAAGTRTLDPGDWGLFALPRVAGFALPLDEVADRDGRLASLTVTPAGRVVRRGGLRRGLARRAPGLLRVARRAAGRGHRG